MLSGADPVIDGTPPGGVLPMRSIVPALDLPMVLKPRFEKGKTYRFVSSSHIQMSIPGLGFRSIEMELQARFDAVARAKGKKGITLRGLTEHLVVKIQSPNQTLAYDSLDPKARDTDLGKHFQAAMARRVEMELNRKNRIVSFREIGRAVLPGPMPGLPEFGPDELKQLVSIILQGYSSDEVKPGDLWDLVGKQKVGQAEVRDVDMKYRQAGQMLQDEATCIVIEFGGIVKEEAAPDEASKPELPLNRIEGRMLFDPVAKMVRLVEQTVSTSVAMPTSDPAAAPLLIPVEQKISISLLHIVPTK